MKRLTRKKDKYECRIDHCPLEDWVMEQIPECTGLSCDGCPVMKHMNKLAEYEDLEEEITEQIDKEVTNILKKNFSNFYKHIIKGEEQ